MHPIMYNNVAQRMGLNLRAGDVGVELEIEGRNLPVQARGWSLHEERSLRGEAREFVTNEPVTLDQLATRLHTLHGLLTAPGVQVNLTGRASTHVHLNVTRLNVSHLFGTMFVATMVEPLLVQLCGPVRNGNLFCLPTYETQDLAPTIGGWVHTLINYGTEFNRNGLRQRGKYACVNIDPVMIQGSIEFRCFPNTINPDDVLRWAGWTISLRNFAENYKDQTYAALYDDIYENPETLIDIFQNEPGWRGKLLSSPEELIRMGVETSYEVYKAALPAFAYVPQKKTRKKKAAPQNMDEALEMVTAGVATFRVRRDQFGPQALELAPVELNWRDQPMPALEDAQEAEAA